MEVDVAQLGPQRATSSGPKSFHDVSALKGDDERTDHVISCLYVWEHACRTRGNAAKKAKTEAVEIFIQADEMKIQPSWVRRWISLVYDAGPKGTNEDDDDDCRSMLSLSTDSAFDGPFPTERYALFLEYYSKLRLDPNDADGSALRVLNAERRRVGIGWTLEHVDEDEGEDSMARDVDMIEDSSIEEGGWRDEGRWGCGGDATANYSAECNQEDMEVDIEVNLGAVAMPDVGPLASLSDFAAVPSPDTSATGKSKLEYMDLSQPGQEASFSRENGPASFPPTPLLMAVSTNAHPDPPMQNEPPSDSMGLAGISLSQNDAACMEGFDSTMEDADALLHPIHTTSAPSSVRGPSSIHDLGSILYPPEGIETFHIREKLLHWKQLDLLQLGAIARRPTRQENTKSERLKEGIARELGIVDAQLVQPSWASQWVQFILDAHDPHSRQLIVYDPSFSPSVPDLVLLLRFFALLMDDTQESRDKALTLLNNERKTRGLMFTLELPKDMAREFKNAGAVVDHDVLMQIEQMPYPISGDTTDAVLESCMDPGGREAMVCDGFGPKYKTPRPKSATAGGRTIQTPQPPWKRPERLPFFEPTPLSSKPADLTSKHADMLAAIGKPEPQTRHVWAKTRTDLCETAPYFRQAQAGIHVDKATRMVGYLLDGFPSPGDIWAREGRLIVSHGGGGSHQVDKTTASAQKQATTQERIVPSSSIALPRHVYDKSDAMPSAKPIQSMPKNVALGADQSREDRTISNLIKAKKLGVPVVLIVGSNYRWWPLKMVKDGAPKQNSDRIDDEQERGKYAVLGWYRVRDAWEELEPGNQSNDRVPLFVRCKFAFEWVETQGTPWWLKDMEEAHSNWLSHTSVLDTIPGGSSSPSNCVSAPVRCQQTLAIDLWSSECCEDPPGLKQASPSTYQCVECLEISSIIYHEGWFCTNAKCSQMGLLLDDRFAPEITLSYSQDFIDRPTLPKTILKGLDGNDIMKFLAPIPEGWPAGWSVIPRYLDGHKTHERVHWNGRCCLTCGRLNSKIQWNVWTCATCSKTIERESDVTYPLVEFLGPGTKGRLNMPTLLPDCTDDPDTCVLYAHLEDGGDIYLIRTGIIQPFESMFNDFQLQALNRDMFRRSPLKRNLVSGMHTKHFQHNAGVPYNFSCEVTTEGFEDGPPVVKQARDLLAETASRILNREIEFNEVLSCAYKKEQSMNYHSDDDIGVQGTIAALSLGSPALMTFRPKQPRRKKSEGGEGEAKEGDKRSLVSPPPCLGFRMQHGDILIMDGIGIQQNYQHQVIPEGLRFAATARLIERPEREDELEHPRRWKATRSGRKKKSDAVPLNPPGLVSFASSSFVDAPATAAMNPTAVNPASAMNPTAVTPVNEESILDFSSASNAGIILPSTTTLTDPYVHTTNAPDSLLGAEGGGPSNSKTMTDSDEPLTNAQNFLFYTTATPMNED